MASGVFSIRQQAQAAGHGAWTGSQTTPYVEYLVVAGGGGGGVYWGGGGGAGGLLQGIAPVTAGNSITVTVGGAGALSNTSFVNGGNGGNSVFGNITAIGGAGGKSYASSSFPSGGSGGGGTLYIAYGGQAVAGQGNAGGAGAYYGSGGQAGGGGGGAGTVGSNSVAASSLAGNGGIGVSSAISGSITTYAGGGGGAGNCGQGAGGAGGGGAGVVSGTANNGATNTGGGGGGQNTQPSAGTPSSGSGGSGIVIISYPDTYNAPSALTGTYTASTSGSGSVYLSGSANYGTIGANTNWTFLHDGTTDWTYEFFAYFSDVTSQQYFFGTAVVSTQPGCYFYIQSNKLYFQISGNNFVSLSSNANALPSTNTWYQIAYTYTASTKTINFYVNGTNVGSSSFAVTMDTRTASYPLGLGHDGGADYWNGGYITNLRISKIKRTTVTNTQTVPFSPDASTYYLLSAVSGAYLADSSGTGLTMTTTGSVVWNQQSPFATGLGYKNRVYTWTGSGTVTF
jgi:hypothetical protein